MNDELVNIVDASEIYMCEVIYEGVMMYRDDDVKVYNYMIEDDYIDISNLQQLDRTMNIIHMYQSILLESKY